MAEGIEKAWELFEFREGDGGYEDAARALAEAVHDAACQGCQYLIKYPAFTLAEIELGRSRCKERVRIEALGKGTDEDDPVAGDPDEQAAML